MNNNILGFCASLYHQNVVDLILTWNITTYCNYKCSYCAAEKSRTFVNSKENRISIDIFKACLHNFKNMNIPIEYRLSGGEPTTHPDFKEILYSLKDEKLIIFANMSTPIDKLKEIFNSLNFRNLSFSTGIHLEKNQSDKQIMQTLERIKFLSANYFVNLFILGHPDYLDLIKKINELCKKELSKDLNVCKFRPVPLAFQTMKNKVYTKEYDEFLKTDRQKLDYYILNQDGDIILEKKDRGEVEKLDWRGYKCFVNLCLFIDKHDLSVTPCGYKPDNIHLFVPSMIEKLKKTIYKPVICKNRYCKCLGTTWLPKIHPDATEEQIKKLIPWYNP